MGTQSTWGRLTLTAQSVSVLVSRRLSLLSRVMCRISNSFDQFNLAILSCSYLIFSVLLLTGISVVLVFEINFQSSPLEIILTILPLMVSLSFLIFGTCCFSSTNKCLQILFFIITTSVLLCEMACGFLLYTSQFDHRFMMDKLVRRVVTEKYVLGSYGENLPLVTLWDGIQQGLQCCGEKGPHDWINNGNSFEENQVKEIGVIAGFVSQKKVFHVPQSCCRNMTTTCENKIIDNTTSNTIYHEGCSNKIADFLLENYQLWLTLTSGVFLLQLLIFITAFSRACFKQEKMTKL